MGYWHQECILCWLSVVEGYYVHFLGWDVDVHPELTLESYDLGSLTSSVALTTSTKVMWSWSASTTSSTGNGHSRTGSSSVTASSSMCSWLSTSSCVWCGCDLAWGSILFFIVREFHDCAIVSEYNLLPTGHVYSNLSFLGLWGGRLFDVVIPSDVARRLLFDSLGESVVDVNLSVRFRRLVSGHIE